MSRNSLWQIAFGDYDFALDRRALTYNLTETKTGTIWAEALPVGWLELEDRETSVRTRHWFADMKLVSLSEKSGQQGKRILLGLDCQGVPVDLYFICSQKEIQLTVEASRDTRTHRVQDICLLPGLVSVPDDGVSYLVIPRGEGAILRAADAPAADGTLPVLPIWDFLRGVTMPFVGAVRGRTFNEPVSALTLITDSAYGAFHLMRQQDARVGLDSHYTHDPERRRLDIRLVVLPEQNHVGVARAYRNKIIIDRNHVTLRQKLREQPRGEPVLGAAWVTFPAAQATELSDTARRLKQELGVERAVWRFLSEGQNPDHYTPYGKAGEPGQERSGPLLEAAAPEITSCGHMLLLSENESLKSRPQDIGWRSPRFFGHDVRFLDTNFFLTNFLLNPHDERSAWDFLEAGMAEVTKAKEIHALVGTMDGSDWRNLAIDYLLPAPEFAVYLRGTKSVPLYSVVYHDSVVAPHAVADLSQFLQALRNIAPPLYELQTSGTTDAMVQRTYAVLGPLHQLSFAAFMSEHRFLTSDLNVEEARYTNGTYVLINQSETDSYENDNVTLPPLGFYVTHPQMTAHDALRVGSEQFSSRAFRIARSQDGKPLSQSDGVLRPEFPM
jgi:hypothetical protein